MREWNWIWSALLALGILAFVYRLIITILKPNKEL